MAGNLTSQTPQRFNPRSKQGCWTCREKKVKCDEEQPTCQRCRRLCRDCDYSPRPRRPYTRKRPPHPPHESPQPPRGQSEGIASTTVPRVSDKPTSPLAPTISPTASITHQSSSNGESSPGVFRPCAADQEAIHYFRTAISKSVDTKDVAFSVPSIIASRAETEPMVMHMVCALGIQEQCYQQGADPCAAVEHYNPAMVLLAEAIQGPTQKHPEYLDNILATLWLMIIYEQRYGDGCGLGLIAHLKGAAMFLQHRLSNLRDLLDRSFSEADEHWHISPFAGRMIVWIAFLDASAESHQLGGDFNRALGAAMTGLAENGILSRLRGFTAIHRYSVTLPLSIWGPEYPQTQFLEDLESREIFYCYGECGQMRHVLAQLADAHESDPLQMDPLPVARALHDIGQRYSEILGAARRLDLAVAGDRKRFVINIRFVVPFYHAVLLWYFRITAAAKPFRFKDKQCQALDEIFAIAYQAYRDEGETAMARIAWPLFMAAIETDDLAHQDWVTRRFAHLRHQGENYRRAEKALLFIISNQQMRKARVGLVSEFQSGKLERFMI